MRLGVPFEVESAPFLNCDNAHLAALQQYYGVSRSADAMACQWGFEYSDTTWVPVTFPVPILECIARETGLRFARSTVSPSTMNVEIARLLSDGDPVMVYGDSLLMPWLPYFGHEEAPHPFIVEGIDADGSYLLVEAYTNSTEWGPVTPGAYSVDAGQFASLVAAVRGESAGALVALESRGEPSPEDPRAIIRRNANNIREHVDRGDLMTFSTDARASAHDLVRMQRFDLGCWEVTRSRSCHSEWLSRMAADSSVALPPSHAACFANTIAAPWKRVSQFAHLSARRLEKGGQVSQTPFTIIEDEIMGAELQFSDMMLAWLGSTRAGSGD